MPEAHERVGVLAAFLGEVFGVGGEVGEVLDERTGGRLACALAEVVERDLHLGAVEEATAAAHAERHAGARERLLEQRRLRVDAVEHGHARPRQVARSRRRAARERHAARFVVGGVVLGERRGGDRRVAPRAHSVRRRPGGPSTALAAATTWGDDR